MCISYPHMFATATYLSVRFALSVVDVALSGPGPLAGHLYPSLFDGAGLDGRWRIGECPGFPPTCQDDQPARQVEVRWDPCSRSNFGRVLLRDGVL